MSIKNYFQHQYYLFTRISTPSFLHKNFWAGRDFSYALDLVLLNKRQARHADNISKNDFYIIMFSSGAIVVLWWKIRCNSLYAEKNLAPLNPRFRKLQTIVWNSAEISSCYKIDLIHRIVPLIKWSQGFSPSSLIFLSDLNLKNFDEKGNRWTKLES